MYKLYSSWTMIELVDELIQICGLSLIDIAFYNVTKFVQLPAIAAAKSTHEAAATAVQDLSSSSPLPPIPVVFHEPGELLVVDKPPDLVINSDDRSRVSASKEPFFNRNKNNIAYSIPAIRSNAAQATIP